MTSYIQKMEDVLTLLEFCDRLINKNVAVMQNPQRKSYAALKHH